MLRDIFSSFDEQNGNLIGFFGIWFFVFFFFFLVISVFWLGYSRFFGVCFLVVDYIWSQVSGSLGGKVSGFSFFLPFLFLFIIFLNFFGLFPYVFSGSSHLVLTLSFSFVFWVSLLVSSVFFSPESFVSHFLPSGAPSFLNPFLVLVETVRVCVRPITLSVRLAANIGAGHIVIGLIGTYFSGSFFSERYLSFLSLFFVERFYFIFEFGICLVQGYIFSLLLVLYSDEHSV